MAEVAEWTSDHRLRGIAYLYLRLKHNDAFATGIPNVKAVVKGRKVYDPCTGTTVYSTNPALCVRDYLTDANFGLGAQTAGHFRTVARRALSARPATASSDLSRLDDQFWRDTEVSFFNLLNELACDESDDPGPLERWFDELRRAALAAFDSVTAKKGHDDGAWKRLVGARKYLVSSLDGDDIRAILGLTPLLERTNG